MQHLLIAQLLKLKDRSNKMRLLFALFVSVIFVITMIKNTSLKLQLVEKNNLRPVLVKPSPPLDIQEHFEKANKRLIAPFSTTGCPCGCPGTEDCLRWYDIRDITDSVNLGEDNEIRDKSYSHLQRRHADARDACLNSSFTSTGGYCLNAPKQNISGYVRYHKWNIPISPGHCVASKRIVEVFSSMILSENITSVNDFGAGVGQYKAAILEKFNNTQYRAYDGAGNIAEYTKGFVSFFDLTLPLFLPKADWVLSLEVGEHIPNKYEAMVIRNLHYHNCRGIILSWAIKGQGGMGHVNNHENQYLELIFDQLGYTQDFETQKKIRQVKDNHSWFTRSVMIFRRQVHVC